MEIFHPRHEKHGDKDHTIFPSTIIQFEMNQLGHMWLHTYLDSPDWYFFFDCQWHVWSNPNKYFYMKFSPHSSHIYCTSNTSFIKINYVTGDTEWNVTMDWSLYSVMNFMENGNPFFYRDKRTMIVFDHHTGEIVITSDFMPFSYNNLLINDAYWGCFQGSFVQHPLFVKGNIDAFDFQDAENEIDSTKYGGKLFMVTRTDDGVIRCYSVMTGKYLWTAQVSRCYCYFDPREQYLLCCVPLSMLTYVLSTVDGTHIETLGHRFMNSLFSQDRSRLIYRDGDSIVRYELFPTKKQALRSLLYCQPSYLIRYLTPKLFVW